MSSHVINEVREYMTASVVSVTEDTPLEEVAKTLNSLDVSCVLVTTVDGAPAGVISLTDLARVSKLDGGKHGPLRMMPPNRRAKEIMKTSILGIDAEASVGEAALKMLHNGVHRLFVRHGDRVVGVFSTRDAMRVVMLRHLEMPLRQVMTIPVQTIGLGDSIDEAIAKLEETNLRGLAVVDGTFPVGIFTQMEAIRARSLSPELRQNPVEEIMSYESITLEASTPLYRAVGQAIATRVRRILVVEGRVLVGIVTGYDLARVLA